MAREEVEGYAAPIMQGLWRRVTTYDVPLPWFTAWGLAGLLQVGVVGFAILRPRLGMINGLMPVVIFCGLQFVVLRHLSLTSPDWDTRFLLRGRQVWRGMTAYLRGH